MIRPFTRTHVLAAALIGAVAALGGTSTPAKADSAYCNDYAHRIAADYTRGNRAVGGALVGGTFGAIIGKVIGGNTGAGVGALIGGSTGAVVGADRDDRRYRAIYNDAYYRCMDGVQPTAVNQ